MTNNISCEKIIDKAITLASDNGHYHITGIPVQSNRTKGFLVIEIFHVTNDYRTIVWKANGHMLLLSTRPENFNKKYGGCRLDNILLSEMLFALCESQHQLAPYLNSNNIRADVRVDLLRELDYDELISWLNLSSCNKLLQELL